MALKTTHILNRSSLICPICYTPGECARHCVEIWLELCRVPHLEQIVKKAGYEDRKSELQERYATPEMCIEGCSFVCWEDEDSDSHLPLFTGAAFHQSGKPLIWTAMFHHSGTKLLTQYRDLVLGQLKKPLHFQRILSTLHKNHKPSTLASSGALRASTTLPPPSFNQRLAPVPPEEDHDVQQMMDDLINNLI